MNSQEVITTIKVINFCVVKKVTVIGRHDDPLPNIKLVCVDRISDSTRMRMFGISLFLLAEVYPPDTNCELR